MGTHLMDNESADRIIVVLFGEEGCVRGDYVVAEHGEFAVTIDGSDESHGWRLCVASDSVIHDVRCGSPGEVADALPSVLRDAESVLAVVSGDSAAHITTAELRALGSAAFGISGAFKRVGHLIDRASARSIDVIKRACDVWSIEYDDGKHFRSCEVAGFDSALKVLRIYGEGV